MFEKFLLGFEHFELFFLRTMKNVKIMGKFIYILEEYMEKQHTFAVHRSTGKIY